MVGGRTVAAVQVGENLSNRTESRLDRQAVFGVILLLLLVLPNNSVNDGPRYRDCRDSSLTSHLHHGMQCTLIHKLYSNINDFKGCGLDAAFSNWDKGQPEKKNDQENCKAPER